MIIWILVAAAVVFILWPSQQQDQPSIIKALPPAAPKKDAIGSYMESMKALQMVRGRLVATDKLDESAQKCLDTLTLALLAGSDK